MVLENLGTTNIAPNRFDAATAQVQAQHDGTGQLSLARA
jgi:hypothetical protein